MTPERWQQINELFTAAVELEPEQRAALLKESCAHDQDLRSEVESLLASDARGLNAIEKPALELAAPLLVHERPQLTPGQTFSHYEVISVLGKGGMGEVYLAADKLLNRKIALKLLLAAFPRHKERLRLFQQEAQAASALNHPNILTIHEIGQADDRQFIATEFVDGETLRQRLKRTPLSLSETLEISIQVAGALLAAHQARIVHRDIKPENIMLRPDGYVKVLDFGLAKLTDATHAEAYATHDVDNVDVSSGLVMGTVKYMSPEQARGEQIDPRSDIFSVGVVMYEMIAGHSPFEGKSTKDSIAAILNLEPGPLAGAPPELQAIVHKCLRKSRSERYQRVEELLNDLKTVKGAWESQAAKAATSTETLSGGVHRYKTSAMVVLALSVIAVVTTIFYLKFVKLRTSSPSFQNIKMTKLTTSGHAIAPAISPDGRYISYGRGENSKVSLWLKEIATNNESEILAPVENTLTEVVFSPDGKYVYYSLGKSFESDIFQIPASGGIPKRLATKMSGKVSVSSGGLLAYVRCEGDCVESTLITANADGTNERVVLKLQGPESLVSAVSWSPTGDSIACFKYSSAEGKYHLIEVNVADGAERQISSMGWDGVESLAWLPDKSGLIVDASDSTSTNQIWQLPYPSGDPRKLTNDVNSYRGVSLSSKGDELVTQLTEVDSRIWITSVDPKNYSPDLNHATQLSIDRSDGTYGISFAPDGRILYRSEQGGKNSIWIMDASGENRKHLPGDGFEPVVTPDGRYIVFSSSENHLCRMDIDGGNLKQLTSGKGELYPSVSPDSKWVYYSSADTKQITAWKVPIDGGAPVQLLPFPEAQMATLSPDGKFIAYGFWADKNEPRIGIASGEGGRLIRSFVAPAAFFPLKWTRDGKAVTFCAYDGTGGNIHGNIWAQPVDGGPSRKLTNFTTDSVAYHAWSPDGTHLAYSRVNQVTDVVLISSVR